MTDINCESYINKSYELLFPSPIILQKLCTNYDKTELFIQSLIRLLIYVLLLECTKNYDVITYILYVILIVNLVYLIIIVFKKSVYINNTDKNMLELN